MSTPDGLLERPTAQALAEAFGHPRPIQPVSEHEAALLDSGQRRDLDVLGHRLATWTWGGPGPRVLLVHGWESRASHWQAWVHPLLRAGFQVVALDNPAHGQSSGERAHVVLWGRALVAAAQVLGPFHAAIGHSAGSAALLYAFAHGLAVEASIHIAGPSSLRRVSAGFARMLGLPRDQLPAFHTRLEAVIGAPLSAMDLDTLRAGLRHPALILHDPQDKEVPYSESVALGDAWPLAELVAIEGVGHRRILRTPEVIDRCLRWLGLPAATPPQRIAA